MFFECLIHTWVVELFESNSFYFELSFSPALSPFFCVWMKWISVRLVGFNVPLSFSREAFSSSWSWWKNKETNDDTYSSVFCLLCWMFNEEKKKVIDVWATTKKNHKDCSWKPSSSLLLFSLSTPINFSFECTCTCPSMLVCVCLF